MLRLNEIKLPLDHDADALERAVLARLGIRPDELLGYPHLSPGRGRP